MTPSLRILVILALLCLSEPIHGQTKVTILPGDPTAGGMETIASFKIPPGAAPMGQLELPKDIRIPYQSDSTGQAWFVWPSQPGRVPVGARLQSAPASLPTAVAAESMNQNGVVRLHLGDRDALNYQAQPGALPRPDIDPLYRRGGYLHSIVTPSGRLVSDDFPPNHIHHHGIWSPWTKTEFEGRDPDFWNMGQGKGRVEFASLEATKTGPVFGGFRARHRFIDMIAKPEKTVLDETWEVKLFALNRTAGRACNLFDLSIIQTCASSSSLKLPKYHYGGLGFRGHRSWDGTTNCQFLTSNGETNRLKGNETQGRWCWMGGAVDGATAGVAILCHPDNFRAPQPMRLHPTEPFFCFAPSQLGDWEISPGRPYRAHYRFVVFDGPPDRIWLDRLWAAYAKPATVALAGP